jgi:uncharacterized membrane protein
MKPDLVSHLWRSQEVLDALKKELLSALTFIGVYILGGVCFRFFTEKPMNEGLLSSFAGAVAILGAWFISVVRTFRTILREHGYLK